MSGGGTSTSLNQNNAQNNFGGYNSGTINVGGSIGNGNTTQNSQTSTQGGSIGISATVNLTPKAPSMPGLQELALIDDINAHIAEIRAPILARYQSTMDEYNQKMAAAQGQSLLNLALIDDINAHIAEIRAPILARY